MLNTDVAEITIVDNSGRKKTEKVLYAVEDVFGDKVYVTEDGLQYIRDSLYRKHQTSFLPQLETIPRALSRPDLVIRDPSSSDDTLIYYKRYYLRAKRQYRLMAIIIKTQGPLKFLYNMHPQQSGKIKGYHETPKPVVLYRNPQRKPSDFGL